MKSYPTDLVMVLQVLRERFQRWHEQNYIPVAESDSEKAAEDLE